MRPQAGDVLRVFTPELPDLKGEGGRPGLADVLFLENCADRFTGLTSGESPRLRLLDAVTMSLDGLTYRLTLKKGQHFHCGAEITAADAVDTIHRVLKLAASASQLHRFVARDRAQGHAFAVRPVSRYRFEIALTRRLPDLLARLALPEFSLRHEGRACFSGLWRIAEQDARGLLLAVHSSHVDAATAQYKVVRWETFRQVPDLGTASSPEATVYLYPGTACRTPPEELLVDEVCRTLDSGVSLLAKVEASPEVAAEVKGRLVHAARVAFGGSSHWRRAPLTALVPKGHVLHVPFHLDGLPTGARRLALALTVDDPVVPRHMWEKLCRVAAEEMRLDVALTFGGEAPTGTTVVPAARATLRSVLFTHPADALSPLSQLAPELAAESRDVADATQALVRVHHFAPLLAVPFVVRSNRTLRKGDATGLLHFADVRQSADRQRGTRVKEAALKSLGAGLQMFVHDVKRPFSLVQGILSLLEAAPTPERLTEITGKYLPDVRRAVDSVARLIQDILEIGSDAEPACEDVAVASLLQGVLREIFSLTPPPGVGLDYRFAHRHVLHVDPQKLGRAVSNVVVNAVEAMGGEGLVWFETTEDEAAGRLTLTVGNTNSYIPEHLLGGLFDRFFTEGKKHGTGLGLAIVKKIVDDHGGEVWCESDRERGTRFRFRLPTGGADEPPLTEALPQQAAAFERRPPEAAAGGGPSGEGDRLATLGAAGGLSVLLVDDDPLYREMIQELLTEPERTAARVRYDFASGCSEATALVSGGDFDVAIVDVDLGPGAEDGLTLVRRLRAENHRLKLCVHSSGPPFELQRRALDAGADLFLPKPLSRDHLVRLLESAQAARRRPGERPRVAVVDDDALALETWQSQAGYEWLTFGAPAEFLAACGRDPGLLSGLLCVVTDHTFVGEAATGLTLAAELAARAPGLPVFLATDRPMPEKAYPGVTAVIGKDPGKGLAKIRLHVPAVSLKFRDSV